MQEIKIEKSLSSDAESIRREVFIDEQGFKNEFDDIDERALHCVCYIDGAAAAAGRTFLKDNCTYIIGRVAVRKTMRNRGVGRTVVIALEDAAKALGAETTELLAQLSAVGFYESLGYIKSGAVVYDEFCPHVWMKKEL